MANMVVCISNRRGGVFDDQPLLLDTFRRISAILLLVAPLRYLYALNPGRESPGWTGPR